MTLATLVLLASPAFAGGSVVPAAAPADVPALESAVSFDAGVDIRGVMTQTAAAWPRALSPWRWRPQPKPQMPWREELDRSVLEFLETFVEKGDIKTAIERHLSTKIDDEKIVGAEVMHERFPIFRDMQAPYPELPMTSAEAARRLIDALTPDYEIPQEVRDRQDRRIPEGLSPIKDAKELAFGLPEGGIVPMVHPNGRIASYPVQRDSDLDWTAGFPDWQSQAILARTIGQDLHLRGVYVLFKYNVGKRVGYSPLFMLWADESYWDDAINDRKSSWKLWAVTSVPTE